MVKVHDSIDLIRIWHHASEVWRCAGCSAVWPQIHTSRSWSPNHERRTVQTPSTLQRHPEWQIELLMSPLLQLASMYSTSQKDGYGEPHSNADTLSNQSHHDRSENKEVIHAHTRKTVIGRGCCDVTIHLITESLTYH